MELPKRLFFTGVPGSRWSSISQTLEKIPGINTSDHSISRKYTHHQYSGHVGCYFGRGMEFEPILDENYINQAWKKSGRCKIIKSHEWSYYLYDIRKKFPEDWIVMVYRPDIPSYSWWHEVGGFEIKYPNYNYYQNSMTMLLEIVKQNSCILEFGMNMKCKWEYFTSEWILENFGQKVLVDKTYPDILVTTIK